MFIRKIIIIVSNPSAGIRKFDFKSSKKVFNISKSNIFKTADSYDVTKSRRKIQIQRAGKFQPNRLVPDQYLFNC